jgi:hypothetical protein
MRRHLSYANVVATLALVFAMSGGALAAKHYLLNSVSQVNPRVLRSLRAASPSVWAQVNSAGEIAASTPGAEATHFGTGGYEVKFRQQVSGCAPEVTEAGLPGREAGGYIPEMARGAANAVLAAPGRNVGVGRLGGTYPSGDAVMVLTYGTNGQGADSAFFITVTC